MSFGKASHTPPFLTHSEGAPTPPTTAAPPRRHVSFRTPTPLSAPSQPLAREMPRSFCGAAGPPLFFTAALLLLIFAVCIGSWTQCEGRFLGQDADLHFGLITLHIESPDRVFDFDYSELHDRCHEFAIDCQNLIDLQETTYVIIALVFGSVAINFAAILILYWSFHRKIPSRIHDSLIVLSTLCSLLAWISWILIAHPLCKEIATSFLADVKVCLCFFY
eukprot:TRINITY_DN7193_c0_g1_i2.p1 TRINITY_DN7193_c0_g1~~TRINITY_DN7193_c0_g1_i2.p1  ORF type:complete len:220 (+),score=35.58 TRINITY_DN7193_c0_g1_i2:57-716(+)